MEKFLAFLEVQKERDAYYAEWEKSEMALVALHKQNEKMRALVDAVRDSERGCGECKDFDPCRVHKALAAIDAQEEKR